MADAIITIPDITVPDNSNLEPAVSLLPQNNAGGKGSVHKWSSVSIQASSANVGNVWVGDSKVMSNRHSAQLAPGQSYSISGSAIDPSLIFVLGDGPLLMVFASGS